MSNTQRRSADVESTGPDDEGFDEDDLEPFRYFAETRDEGDPIGDFCRSVVRDHSSDNREAN
ncbi:hypothetical protein [Halobellus rubicundus]|uniref:Uncharacterized protein n=1 Tax=Halobellus rubicundus TaxID=2996466 RepID=A0ABD5MDV9_9EURY